MERIVEGFADFLEEILKGPDMCSCSPCAFDLVLDLSRNCFASAVEGSPGISLVFYFHSSVRAALLERSLSTPTVWDQLSATRRLTPHSSPPSHRCPSAQAKP